MIKDVHTCIMDLTRCQGTPSFEVTQAHHKWSAIYVTWRYICMMVQQKETRCSRLKRRKLQSKPFPLPKRIYGNNAHKTQLEAKNIACLF